MDVKNNKIAGSINAILFDMVGVLLFQKKDYVPQTIDEINANNIEKLYNHVNDSLLIKDVKNMLHLTDKQINDALPYIPKKFEKFQSLWNMLPELKKKFRLAIVNNGNNIAWNYWKNTFDFSIFELFVNSAKEGIRKPDPQIYLLTCNKLGIDPKKCLFIDDTKENIETAKKLGMKILWWDKKNGRETNLKAFLNLISD